MISTQTLVRIIDTEEGTSYAFLHIQTGRIDVLVAVSFV